MTQIARLGLDCKLYIEGVEVPQTREILLKLSAKEADITTRSCGGWKQTVTALREAELEITLLDIPDDPVCATLREKYATSGSDGLISIAVGGVTGEWSVTGIRREEPIEGAVTQRFILKLTRIISLDSMET